MSLLHVLVLASIALAAPLLSIHPRGKPSIDPRSFAADSSINVAAIYSAVKGATKSPIDRTYATSSDEQHHVQIYQDWHQLKQVQAYHFLADMDIDCDGVDVRPDFGDTHGDAQTDFGALNATAVPWYVLPEQFVYKKGVSVKNNALGAIICDGKMFYAIFGDSNGANPQVIGEGSLLLGQACFPKDKITGNNGHVQRDVAYIVFANQAPKDVQRTTLNIGELKTLGDQQVRLLVKDLKL
ncbi:fungal chitosanase of glycosyl hydrolase group 75-domain-containing protein [Mycena capillaripes]|nr:fungal chitosanase of glycosyl hydrolase group 75-domain-containing protein [Mycena capillaripes]